MKPPANSSGCARHRLAPGKQDARGQRQFVARTLQQHGEARHDHAQQEEHDQRPDAEQQRGIDRRAHELAAQQPHGFQVQREAPQGRYQVAGLLAGGDRGHQQRRKYLGTVGQRRRQRQALRDVAGHGFERFARAAVALLLGQRAQRVDHAQSGVEQRGQLVGEQADVQTLAPEAAPPFAFAAAAADRAAGEHAQPAQLHLLGRLAFAAGAQALGLQRAVRRHGDNLEQRGCGSVHCGFPTAGAISQELMSTFSPVPPGWPSAP